MSYRCRCALIITFGFALTGLCQSALHFGYIEPFVAGLGQGFGSCLMLFAWAIAQVSPNTAELDAENPPPALG